MTASDDYFDTSVLVSCHIKDALFKSVSVFVEHYGVPIAVNAFQRAEFENAVRLKVFRKEVTAEDAAQARQRFNLWMLDGRFVRQDVDWPTAFAGVMDISRRVTEKTGCRTLDILHLAVAVQWGCKRIVSADERQLAAAKRLGFETADLRL
jgi:predicted nucleic acid-binding protein